MKSDLLPMNMTVGFPTSSLGSKPSTPVAATTQPVLQKSPSRTSVPKPSRASSTFHSVPNVTHSPLDFEATISALPPTMPASQPTIGLNVSGNGSPTSRVGMSLSPPPPSEWASINRMSVSSFTGTCPNHSKAFTKKQDEQDGMEKRPRAYFFTRGKTGTESRTA